MSSNLTKKISIMPKFKDNILYLRKKKKLTQEQIAEKLGVGRTTITNYEAGTSEPSYELLSKLANILDVGVGELLDVNLTNKKYPTNNDQFNYVAEPDGEYIAQQIPLIPQSAKAGLNTFDICVYKGQIDQYFKVPILNQAADFAIKIEGDSMSPKYAAGTYVICKNITGVLDVRWERVYLILVNHAPMLKRIYPSQNAETLILRSDNQLYRDIEVLKNDINSIAEILATVQLEC